VAIEICKETKAAFRRDVDARQTMRSVAKMSLQRVKSDVSNVGIRCRSYDLYVGESWVGIHSGLSRSGPSGLVVSLNL
jgi:hypothetical protein